nr:copia protein [Tanacetum cinerariifolium]
STSSKLYEESSSQVPEGSGNPNPTASAFNPLADQIETLTMESLISTVSLPVPTACLNDSSEPSSEARLVSKRVANQEETPSLDNILSLTNRFDDILGVSTCSDEIIGVEVDVRNMETSISASPTPTLRIHKNHPKSQIIGHVDTPIQTRHKSNMMAEQIFMATIHQKTDSALLYSQVPKGSGNPNPTASSSNPLVDQMKTLTVESPIPTVSLLVLTAYLNDSPEPSSKARLILKRVGNQEETPSLDNILSLSNRFEDILGVTTSLDEAIEVEADVSNLETTISASPTPKLRIHKDHPKSQIIGHVDTPIQTRHKNKTRLVAQGHTQEEGIDYDEVFAPVARIEAIRLFLAYASFMGFTVYQMDVKSAFLYDTIDEEVYVMQPPGFQDPAFPARVYKVEKAMYGLHQAPRAWHQVTPKECHLHAVKRIFRYLKGHP